MQTYFAETKIIRIHLYFLAAKYPNIARVEQLYTSELDPIS